MRAVDFPTAEDLYQLIEDEFAHYDEHDGQIYTKDMLRELLLGLHRMCRGRDRCYFNVHTNVTDDVVGCFGG